MQSKLPRQRVSHRRSRCMLAQPCIRHLAHTGVTGSRSRPTPPGFGQIHASLSVATTWSCWSHYGGSVALYLGAVLVSLIDFRWGLGLCVGLTLLYLLPPPRPRYVDDQS
jgi:hypothetical protein